MKTQALIAVPQPNEDSNLINIWLHTKSSENTRCAYTRIILEFVVYVDKPLLSITLHDLQDYIQTITGEPSTIARTD